MDPTSRPEGRAVPAAEMRPGLPPPPPPKRDPTPRQSRDPIFQSPRVNPAGKMDGVEVAPFRTLDEFILGESRFQVPDFNNLDKWTNRIVNNLLYFQTNYFVSAVLIFLMISFLHPGKMFLGILTMAIIFGGLYYCAHTQVPIKNLKKNHPALAMLGTFCIGYFLVYQFGCMLVFLSGVVLPILFILGHASLRLRGIKNKANAAKGAFWKKMTKDKVEEVEEVTNVAETLGMGKKTPMGIFLDEFGIEPEMKYM